MHFLALSFLEGGGGVEGEERAGLLGLHVTF